MVKLGANLPEHLIGTDHGALSAFLEGLEELGYGYVTVGDHILGADLSVRPDWRPYFGKAPLYDHRMAWHEPMVLFGFLAAMTRSLELATGILVAPQRQTALLAKQLAEVDILSGGRVRPVVAVGWNDVEFEGCGVDFAKRGRIMDEQIEVLRLLWTQESVSYHGAFHTMNAVGINPLPVNRPIPLWFGGCSAPVLRRIGRAGDGWFPHYPYFSAAKVSEDLATISDHARDAGRDPSSIGIEAMAYFHDPRFEMPPGAELPPSTLDASVDYAKRWKDLGATHFWVTPSWAGLGPEETGVREPGKQWAGVDERLKAYGEFIEAVGPDF
jgi:probable F420-dependent oxidoreductase